MENVDCVVIGAGVVGLAAARALAMAGREVLVLEAAGTIGTGTSSRNSEVIHAGIYYPQGSLMARACVAGRRRLYDYCAARGVDVRRCGKIIVATDASEAEQLAAIRARAEANGVENIRLLGLSELRAMEPALDCTAGLLSPETGIVDSHGLMLALQGDAEAHGAIFAFHSPVRSGRVTAAGIDLEVGDADPMLLRARSVVNAAGLFAPELARKFVGLEPAHVPPAYFAKGHYFLLRGRAPFSRLIYPVPVPGGLGVHLTLDLGGQAKFGPDVSWIESPDYSFDPGREGSFYRAIRRYWPDLADGALVPGYTGIRPKIVPQGAASQDFVVQGAEVHGVPGLVNLLGIESPGLTSSLFLGDLVAERLPTVTPRRVENR
ncbi:NAD(P)/FAD-dependent oxidoreductase [Paracoccus litorisediminis]|uniref:FAD-dependent oxidoreductase n=1 Tax=Paracoccus litorisediminis TaxID=2006130 RepID=A0A844HQD8_9RHOB|nr:NAD(P)/FAD-dependent oxidoreductase [Paracoccus litorisediminis]MTH61278.1 FAD-dependent oxidoreductase [Paracoccus litorisediminis]